MSIDIDSKLEAAITKLYKKLKSQPEKGHVVLVGEEYDEVSKKKQKVYDPTYVEFSQRLKDEWNSWDKDLSWIAFMREQNKKYNVGPSSTLVYSKGPKKDPSPEKQWWEKAQNTLV